MLGFVFGIPTKYEIFLSIKEEALKAWNNKVIVKKMNMNEN